MKINYYILVLLLILLIGCKSEKGEQKKLITSRIDCVASERIKIPEKVDNTSEIEDNIVVTAIKQSR